ncbi:MAG: helix-turn-helix domain-containing protein [Bacilli bacterium]|nr:helix-turn-helix domain-containing protein [Bacilli bacterium]
MEMFLKNSTMIISVDIFMDKVWVFDSETDMSVVWTYIS